MGTSVVTTVGVDYVDYKLVTLSPETISFRWVGSAGEKIVENAPVVSKGGGSEHMGNLYTYEQKVGDDFPTGTVTIFILACSCSDGQGNYGPTADTSSDESYEEADNSRIEIGATMQQAAQPGTQDLLAAYGVPIVIVVILAVLLLVLRRRKKKT